MTASVEGAKLGGAEIEQKGKRIYKHGHSGGYWGQEGLRGLNGNENNHKD